MPWRSREVPFASAPWWRGGMPLHLPVLSAAFGRACDEPAKILARHPGAIGGPRSSRQSGRGCARNGRAAGTRIEPGALYAALASAGDGSAEDSTTPSSRRRARHARLGAAPRHRAPRRAMIDAVRRLTLRKSWMRAPSAPRASPSARRQSRRRTTPCRRRDGPPALGGPRR